MIKNIEYLKSKGYDLN